MTATSDKNVVGFRQEKVCNVAERNGHSQDVSGDHLAAFVQPFSMNEISGGARILQSVVPNAPMTVHSISTRPAIAGTNFGTFVSESFVPFRPDFGRIERTRFGRWTKLLDPLFSRGFRRRLRTEIQRIQPSVLHLIPHATGEFFDVMHVAEELSLPYVVSIHDDLAYTGRGAPYHRRTLLRLGSLWQRATRRLVICEAMGKEYCQRYGDRGYAIHTDGKSVAPITRPPVDQNGPIVIYFMGLFHNAYSQNLMALIQTVSRLREKNPQIMIRLRCGSLPRQIGPLPDWVECLPFAPEATVRSDMENADALYLPLPFGDEQSLFARLSLSTKFVTYLSTGLPILYHGPNDSALADFLVKHEAGVSVYENTIDRVEDALKKILFNEETRQSLRNAALIACESEFHPDRLTTAFWKELDLASNSKRRAN